jgi:hypothetical protein
MTISQDYIQQLLDDRNTIPFYLSESNWDSTFLALIETINSGTNLNFVRNTDNTNTIIDIYVYEGIFESGWSAYEYDSFLALEINTAEGASVNQAEELIGEMLGTVLGLQNSSGLDDAAIGELANKWGNDDMDNLLANIENEGEIQTDETDTYTITIDEQADESDRYIILDINDEYADLDLSLVDSSDNVLASAQTTNQTEYLDLAEIAPGSYLVYVYGYGGSTSDYSISYVTSSDTSIDDKNSNQPWDDSNIIDLGVLEGTTTQSRENLIESSFFGFEIEGDTNIGEWKITIGESPWNSDLDLFLYREDDPSAAVISSSASYGSDEQINLNGLEAGTYILEVRNFLREASDYLLTIESPYTINDEEGDSLEGNNTFDNATIIEATGSYEQGGLSIHNAEDIDYFRFELAKVGEVGSYAQISLGDGSGDLDLYLYNSDGVLVNSSASTMQTETISLTDIAPDTYTLAVSGYLNATGSYALSLDLPIGTSTLPDDHFENEGGNGEIAQASDLGTISGVIAIDDLTINSQGNDLDYFKFTITDQGSNTNYIELIGNTNSEADLDMSLYTSTGVLIETSNGWGSAETITLNNLESGSYILGVNSYNRKESNYRLTFDAPEDTEEPLKDDAYEPNNSEDRATELIASSGSLYLDDLNLSNNNDIDWYEIDIPENIVDGSYIRFNSLDETESIKVTFKSKESEDILYRDETLQTFTELELSHFLEGSYLIQVAGEQTNYDLDLKILQDDESTIVQPDRFENNNSITDAELIRLDNKSILLEDLTIHDSTDSDWFRFSIPVGSTESSGITIQFNNSEGDLDLELHEVYSDSETSLINTSASTTNEEFIGFEGLSAGEYAAKVYAYNGISSEYSLTIDVPITTIEADRFENNNKFKKAYDLRTLEGVSNFDGSIHKSKDKDFFKFKTLADTTLAHSVSLEGGSDLMLTVYNKNKKKLNSGSGSVSLADLEADTNYFVKVGGQTKKAELGNYSLNFQLPSQLSTNQDGNTEDGDSLSDWTMMVYITADDLDYFAYSDINEMEDAISNYYVGANVAVYWDQSADGRSNPYSTGNGSQPAWTTAGKAFIQADSDLNDVGTDFLIEPNEVNTGDPDTLYEFITWAADEAPAENYGLVMWNHGGGVKGFNYDYSDNAPADNLVTTEFVEALEKTQNDGINFDLIAFDACLMGMIEVGYEIRNYTDYFVAAEEVVGGDGYDYTTAFSAFESELGNVNPDELAQSLVQSFEEFYVYGGNDADTLSAVNTNELEELAESLKSFTDIASEASEEERGAMSSLRNQSIRYAEKNFVDLGDWLKKVSRSQVVSVEIRDLAENVLESIDMSVEFKTRDSRNSSGLAIYFPKTSQSQDPIGSFYQSEYENFLTATGWYSFLETLDGLSGSTAQLASSRSFNPILGNASASRPLDLGLLSGSNNRIPLSRTSNDTQQFFEFRFEGDAGSDTTIEQIGMVNAEISIRTIGSDKSLVSGTDSISLNDLDAGTYLVSIDSDSNIDGIRPELVINVPEAVTNADVINNSLLKAEELGLITSDRLLTGGLISNGQNAYYRFETPRFSTEVNYNLELLTSGSVELEAKILSADGETTIVEGSGVGSIEMNHIASGQGESYILLVSSPENSLSSENFESPTTTSFTTSVVVEAESIFIDPSELPTIESISDVEAIEEISNFALNNGLLLKNNFIDTIIVGTKKKDVIIGSSEGEVIAGLENKDVLKGGDGADGFLFSTNEFGNKKADLIRDFDPDEGDSIVVKQDTFNIYGKIKIKSVNGKSKAKQAAKSKNDFIYDNKNGLLYFNEDGKEKGWGDGGLLAKLQGKPDLSADDFTIV